MKFWFIKRLEQFLPFFPPCQGAKIESHLHKMINYLPRQTFVWYDYISLSESAKKRSKNLMLLFLYLKTSLLFKNHGSEHLQSTYFTLFITGIFEIVLLFVPLLNLLNTLRHYYVIFSKPVSCFLVCRAKWPKTM